MAGDSWHEQTVGGFRIVRHVGEGFGGELYEAEQTARSRPALVKLVAPSVAAGPGFAERFARDAELLSSFFHPHVVTVYAAGTDAGTSFLGMRPIDARGLDRVIEEEGALDHQRAGALLADAAAGLDEAHRRGLVHRGLSPASILVGERDGREHAWVTDFAVADDTSQYGGLFAPPAGTAPPPLDYVSPEQVRGDPASAASDVYALGAILFHALTGRPLFGDLPDGAKLEAHLHAAVPSASELVDHLPTPYDVVLAKALAKDPADRFASAAELAEAAPSKGRVLSNWRSMLAAGTMAPEQDEAQPEAQPEAQAEAVAAAPATPEEDEPPAGDAVEQDVLVPDGAAAGAGADAADDDTAGTDGEPAEHRARSTGGRRALAVAGAVLLLAGATGGVLVAAGVVDLDDDDPAGEVAQEPAPVEEPAPELTPEPVEEPAPEEEPAAEAEPAEEEEPAQEPQQERPSGATRPWPAGRSAHTAVVFASATDRAGAMERARRAARLGMRAGVVSSSTFTNVVPGVWVAYAGIYDSAAQAQQAVQRIQQAGIAARPYVRYLQSR